MNMAKPESIVGTIQKFRARQGSRQESLSYEEREEGVERAKNFRVQLQDLIRSRVEAPDIIESDTYPSNRDHFNVTLTATIPTRHDPVTVNIAATEYPLVLTEKEEKIEDEAQREREVYQRLGRISYQIYAIGLDHRVHVDGWRAEKVSVLSGVESDHLRAGYATLDKDYTVGRRSFANIDYARYIDLIDTLLTDAGVTFEGRANDIYQHVERKTIFRVRPAERDLQQPTTARTP